MRHQKAGRKLGRTGSHRIAMFKNMLTSFFEKEKIETTTIKAKELRPLAEKLITLGKRGGLHARRRALRLIANKKVVNKLFNEIASRFKSRPGGYTRIIRTGYRAGDKAPMSVIELIPKEIEGRRKKGQKKKKTLARAKPEARKEIAQAESREEKGKNNTMGKAAGVEIKVDGGLKQGQKDQNKAPSDSQELKGSEKESGIGGLGSESVSDNRSSQSAK